MLVLLIRKNGYLIEDIFILKSTCIFILLKELRIVDNEVRLFVCENTVIMFVLLRQICIKQSLKISTKSYGQQTLRYLNSNTASICKVHREVYTWLYPTVVVLPDGSSINICHHEPRKIIKLPLDLSTLSEAEQQLRLERRKPKQKIKIEEDIEDDYDASKYVHLLKK